MASDTQLPLFDGICFHILEDHINTEKKEETIRMLKDLFIQGGAMEEPFISHLVTHVIADTVVTDIDTILGDDCKAVVINSKWVLLSCQNGSLLPVEPFESQKDKIFTGVMVCPTGISDDDKHKLHALVLYYGGEFQRTLNARVTHLVGVAPQGPKYNMAVTHNIPMVKPEWILECIRQHERLPIDSYRLSGTVNTRPTSLVVETVGVVKGNDSSLVIVNETLIEGQGDMRVDNSVPMDEHESRNGDHLSLGKPLVVPVNEIESKIRGYTSKPSSESPPLSDKDTIASTPQSTQVVSTIQSNGEDLLLEGMVFMILDYTELLNSETLSKWNEVISKHGGQTVSVEDSHKCTHLLSHNTGSELYRKVYRECMCVASAHWLNDILSEQKMFPPKYPLHLPVSYENTPTNFKSLSISLTNYCDKERSVLRDMIRVAGLSYTGHLCRSVTHLVCKRPEGRKYEKALDWGVPVVNSIFISDIMHTGSVPVSTTIDRYSKLDQPNEFTTPCSERIKYMKSWEQFMNIYPNLHLIDHKSCAGSFHNLNQSIVPNSDAVYIMFTGFNPAIVKRLKLICKSIHAKTTTDPKKCTHLVAPRIARTVKFLCAISVCKYILTSDWLESCKNEGRLVDESGYTLCDKEGEEAFNMSITVSLQRASERKLLNGLAIHITRNVVPDFESFKSIIECAGGKVYTQSDLYSVYGRKYERLAVSDSASLLIVISCVEDVGDGVCTEFYHRMIPVYSAEFILTGILQQSLAYDNNQLQQPQ